MNKFFAENRPMFKGGREKLGGLLPRLDRRGANCTESARQKFNAQESWDARGKLSQRILSGEEPVCGPEEKDEAMEQLKRYVAVKKFEIDRKYEEEAPELLKGKSGDELEKAKLKEKAVYEVILGKSTLFGHFDSLPADEKKLIEQVSKKGIFVGSPKDLKSLYEGFLTGTYQGEAADFETVETVDNVVLNSMGVRDYSHWAGMALHVLRERGGALAPELKAECYLYIAMNLLSTKRDDVLDLAEELTRKAARIWAAMVDRRESGRSWVEPRDYLAPAYVQLADILRLKQAKSGKMNAPDDKVVLFYELAIRIDPKNARYKEKHSDYLRRYKK